MVTFTQADLDLFCAASHDRNPLHRSPEYARRTAFGQPVVYGVLGALAGLGALPRRPGERLAGLTLEFMHPLFVGVDYRVQTDGQSFALYEGRRLATRGTARFTPLGAAVGHLGDGAPARVEAAVRTEDELIPGLTVEGDYAPAAGPLQALAERFGLEVGHLAALLFASYLVGMELPGRDALFQQAAFTFEPPALTGGFRAVVTAYDRRFQLLRVRAELAGVATVETRAFVRRPTPALSAGALAELLPPSEAMAGQVALVIGASRGLGAAVARALASQGCRVAAAYSRSAAEAEQLAAETAGAVVPVQGDGADLAWCLALRERIRQEYGRLDLLVCSAAPPLLPLSLDPDTVLRAERYVADSLALTSRPLAAFLPLLAERKGWSVVISSVAVKEPPADWPHYVAAKGALEGLARTAAAQYAGVRSLIVRPPRLMTDLTNTPMGHQQAMPVERVAAALVKRLQQGVPGLLEEFRTEEGSHP